MAELTINTNDIVSALRKHLEGFDPAVETKTVGRVMEVGDGIAYVSGLPKAGVNELLEFEDGTLGLALNLDEESIGAVVLGAAEDVEEGQTVKATGRILSVPVGDGLLGRVVNALGEPIDGRGPLVDPIDRRLEIQAPSIMGRKPVHEPMQTGIKAIDAMTPIGRGQRELIIGDRKTGKTTVAIDTILNQKGQGVKCIYVAIGQKGSTVAQTVATLEARGAMDYTAVVVAPASDPAPFKYLAPYAGCAMGQHWMENGEHALVVYDDLSKQAEAYRQLSLLLRRPPGREAYPGDVFYLHSRLLERAAKLSDERGAGSLTALPIIETKGGDVSAYIPTNVISITDGQIYLIDDLFKSGVRPAVDVGISVSRVGGNAQIKAMKSVAGTLKIDLAQFRDLEAFATFGSELDAVSKAQLERGYRLVELLKQNLNSPMPVEEQVISIFAGTNGYLDDLPVTDVKRFEQELLEVFHTRHGAMLEEIRSKGTLPDGVRDAVAAFKNDFAPGFDEATIADPLATDADALGEAESDKTLATEQPMAGGQERILKRRIKTVQATKKITRAMELIAASRIARAQERVRQAVPYSEQITEVVKDLAAAAGVDVRSPLLEPRPDVRREAFLVLVADRGLCGGYNSSVLRAAEGEVKRIALEGKEYGLISVGRKAETYFRFRGYHTEASFTGFSERPTYADAKAIATSVMGMYERGEIDRLEIIYTRFVSVGVQEVLQRPLIPLDRDVVEGGDAMPATVDGHAGPQASYEFEPSPDAILDTLLPRYVEARIYAALLNASASEQAARQRAMKAATDNAEDLIINLSRIMNRARQDAITTEIMEIVGGAEALKSDDLVEATIQFHIDLPTPSA